MYLLYISTCLLSFCCIISGYIFASQGFYLPSIYLYGEQSGLIYMGSRVDWKPLASEDVQRTNYQLSLISFFNQLFYVFMQSTCRKMKKIPDTVWMTMIQQYNKNSGKDGKQQGMQVRNEFQSQACPWPSTHSDWVHIGEDGPLLAELSKVMLQNAGIEQCFHKCWKHLFDIFIVCESLWKTWILSWRQSLQRKTWTWIKTLVSLWI